MNIDMHTFATIVGTSVTLTAGIITLLVKMLLRTMNEKTKQKYDTIEAELRRLQQAIDKADLRYEKCSDLQVKERRRAIHETLKTVSELRDSLSKFRDRWDVFHIDYQRKTATTTERVNTAIKAIDTIRLEIKNIEERVPKQLDRVFREMIMELKHYVNEQIDELGTQ